MGTGARGGNCEVWETVASSRLSPDAGNVNISRRNIEKSRGLAGERCAANEWGYRYPRKNLAPQTFEVPESRSGEQQSGRAK